MFLDIFIGKLRAMGRDMPDWTRTYDPAFISAVSSTLLHEGFFSDDKDDPGGPTKYGVSLRFLRTKGLYGDFDGDGDVDRDDIWAMTEDEAVEVYYEFWWRQEGYDKIPGPVGAKVFDIAINTGPKASNRSLQRAVRAVSGVHLVDDGILGRKSKAAVKKLDSDILLPAFRSEAAGHYRVLRQRNEVFRKYIEGWLNRAYA